MSRVVALKRKEIHIYIYLCLFEGNEKNTVRRIQNGLCKKKLVRVCPAVTIVGIKLPLKIVSSKVIEFQKIRIYIFKYFEKKI